MHRIECECSYCAAAAAAAAAVPQGAGSKWVPTPFYAAAASAKTLAAPLPHRVNEPLGRRLNIRFKLNIKGSIRDNVTNERYQVIILLWRKIHFYQLNVTKIQPKYCVTLVCIVNLLSGEL